MFRRARGFTIVELLIVISVIGILVGLVAVNYVGGIEKAKLTRAKAELQTFANAFQLYLQAHDSYPPDRNRGVLSDVNEYITKDQGNGDWPYAPWGPPSMYDYDAWDIDGDGVDDTFQISIRFCPAGGGLSSCKFPDEPWAKNFGVDSAMYYCIKGSCRSHKSQPITYPGYCVNCPGNKAIGA